MDGVTTFLVGVLRFDAQGGDNGHRLPTRAQLGRPAVGLLGHHHRPRLCPHHRLQGHRWSARRDELQPHSHGVVLRGFPGAIGRKLAGSKEMAGLGTMNSEGRGERR
ncbi:hypothetical protein CRG98_036835 [Punica granatum]|uniref:Uncharacterized protein n=1 Tax=Punica granatum TaxID=22663 RepID=A0A2I0IFE9_PUNGR|nr:hypothetical protein CRG98_036835 [Punica granatum]